MKSHLLEWDRIGRILEWGMENGKLYDWLRTKGRVLEGMSKSIVNWTHSIDLPPQKQLDQQTDAHTH